jgi:hypothetical protein
VADGLTIRVEGADRVSQMLKTLPAEVERQGGNAIRSALRDALKPMQAAAQAGVDRITATPNVGGVEVTTGLLRESIVIRRGRMPPGVKGERYLLRVSRKRYGENRGRNVTTPQVGRLLEYGWENYTAQPWLRPAYEAEKAATAQRAVSSAEQRLQAILDRLTR